MLRSVISGLALMLAVSVVAPLSVLGRSASPVAESGHFSGRVDIGGGRHLYLECRGTGGPTVVLEAGFRSPETVWTDDLAQTGAKFMVLPGVAQFTRVCAYERPGVNYVGDGRIIPSRSDPVPMPRPVEDVVSDLHALLQAAGVQGPYVLVGHSLGGLMVRLYAATFPDEVVGMLLVDAFSEFVKASLSPEDWDKTLKLNAALPADFADDPNYETIDFGEATDAVSAATAAHPLPTVPLIVLSRGVAELADTSAFGLDPKVLEDAWRVSQDRLAEIVPNAEHIVATESGHYIQLQQPELVIDAIRRVVDAVRDPSSRATPLAG